MIQTAINGALKKLRILEKKSKANFKLAGCKTEEGG